jgi:hypothetical protein
MWKQFVTRRRVIAGSTLYLLLWALTELGAARVRTSVAERHIPVADCPRLKACESAAVAVAPFLLKADYFWDSGTLAGEGASVLYVWFGGSGVEMVRWNILMI